MNTLNRLRRKHKTQTYLPQKRHTFNTKTPYFQNDAWRISCAVHTSCIYAPFLR